MDKPLLTTLSYSGGRQSSALLWMILLEKLDMPENFVVLTANPGMENSGTYKYVDMMEAHCNDAGIDFYKVEGPNLYDDIVTLKYTHKTRLDNPPYFTKNILTDNKGKLGQKCTQHYKIKPMSRKIREILDSRFGISRRSGRVGCNIVETWIGFTYSEVERVKPSKRKYQYFRYPLIEMNMSNDDVIRFFNENEIDPPPRSVCNACFANGLNTLKDMCYERPEDWEQAVRVDKSVRDWLQIGVRDAVYVSNTWIGLEELKSMDFNIYGKMENIEKDYSCDSGYCFI